VFDADSGAPFSVQAYVSWPVPVALALTVKVPSPNSFTVTV
jgi:hypothetical protein